MLAPLAEFRLNIGWLLAASAVFSAAHCPAAQSIAGMVHPVLAALLAGQAIHRAAEKAADRTLPAILCVGFAASLGEAFRVTSWAPLGGALLVLTAVGAACALHLRGLRTLILTLLFLGAAFCAGAALDRPGSPLEGRGVLPLEAPLSFLSFAGLPPVRLPLPSAALAQLSGEEVPATWASEALRAAQAQTSLQQTASERVAAAAAGAAAPSLRLYLLDLVLPLALLAAVRRLDAQLAAWAAADAVPEGQGSQASDHEGVAIPVSEAAEAAGGAAAADVPAAARPPAPPSYALPSYTACASVGTAAALACRLTLQVVSGSFASAEGEAPLQQVVLACAVTVPCALLFILARSVLGAGTGKQDGDAERAFLWQGRVSTPKEEAEEAEAALAAAEGYSREIEIEEGEEEGGEEAAHALSKTAAMPAHPTHGKHLLAALTPAEALSPV